MYVINVIGYWWIWGFIDYIVKYFGLYCGVIWLDVLMYLKRILKEIGIND